MDAGKLAEKFVDRFAEVVGRENVSTDVAELYCYGFDASIYRSMPGAVVRPKNAEEVSGILRICHAEGIPIVPRGAGTALCGQAIPLNKAVVLDMTRMAEIREVRPQDLYCTVEPGVVYENLNKVLAKQGFSFPTTPGSSDVCTIGGMVAVNASGMRAVKYGATRDYVLGLKVVLPDGKLISCGTKTIKNSGGYQLEKLFVGSEGTLGVITEVTLRITPLPKKRSVVLASFDKLETAGECVSNIIASRILPSALEIMDRVCIEAVKKSMKLKLPDCEALLLIESDGHEKAVSDEIDQIYEICKRTGAREVEFAHDAKRMEELWAGRKGVLPSLSRYGENFVSVSLADDMAVPISQIPKAVKAFQEISRKYGIIIGTYGHAGDGNLHTKVLLDATSKDYWERAEKAVGEIFDAVFSLGGTTTGEHGIALAKAPYMKKERASSLELMRAIKKAIDPKNIMNPGKIFDAPDRIIYSLRYPVKK